MSDQTVSPEVKEPTPVASPTLTPEEKSLAGEKEVAKNDAAKDAAEPTAEPIAAPSFFVEDSDRIRIAVDILWDARTGRPSSVSKVGLGIDFKELGYLGHSEEWFEFSVPTYEDITTYRQRSSNFRREANAMVVDKAQLRNFFVVWHLKDWSLRDRKGNKVPLALEENGCLHDDSIAKVMAVPSCIMDVVLSLFEKEIMLT